jgi:hypothetical protein
MDVADGRLTSRLERAVRSLFEPADVPSAIAYLVDECAADRLHAPSESLLERVRAAALKVSGGSLHSLKAATALAQADWRDLLMAAEFGLDIDAHEKWLSDIARQR